MRYNKLHSYSHKKNKLHFEITVNWRLEAVTSYITISLQRASKRTRLTKHQRNTEDAQRALRISHSRASMRIKYSALFHSFKKVLLLHNVID